MRRYLTPVSITPGSALLSTNTPISVDGKKLHHKDGKYGQSKAYGGGGLEAFPDAPYLVCSEVLGRKAGQAIPIVFMLMYAKLCILDATS